MDSDLEALLPFLGIRRSGGRRSRYKTSRECQDVPSTNRGCGFCEALFPGDVYYEIQRRNSGGSDFAVSSKATLLRLRTIIVAFRPIL